MKVLVTGSGGLIGFESCKFFLEKNWKVLGIDNDMRSYFFGKEGSTKGNISHLQKNKGFVNHSLDIRNRDEVIKFFEKHGPFDLIIHTAAQPSHDWAAREPFTEFDVNANGTFNLLEAYRLKSKDAVFIFTSTNKVYGDNPNKVKLVEKEKRYDYDPKGKWANGISEEMSPDHCTHSLFGASKLAADICSQEYGRYFGLNVGIFRGGCLTGPQHAAVELHGFLTYIANCAKTGRKYTIFGYKGKQVRDQIHSYDVVNSFWHFFQKPRKGEAYNIGGMKQNSASVLEIIDVLKEEFRLSLDYKYDEKNRIGDHICYYSDMGKFKSHFPKWRLDYDLRKIIEEIVNRKI